MERRLAFSWISERLRKPAVLAGRPVLSPALQALRVRGHRGGVIEPHRAFIGLHPTLGDFVGSAALVIGTSLGWVRLLPLVGQLWGSLFRLWASWLGFEAVVSMVPEHWTPRIHFELPFLNLPAGGITPTIWIVCAVVTLAVFAGTYLAGEEHVHWVYMVRAIALIQGSALVYFAVAAARFPHDLPTYTTGMLSFGILLIGLVPPVLGLTYYVFDFSIWKKLGLTVVIIAHLTLFIPLQYMLQVYILHFSILFMPLLYFVFGPFLDVLIFVSLYSWGMSWQSRRPSSA